MSLGIVKIRLLSFAVLAFAMIPARMARSQNYLTDIKPILKARCYACHGALKQEAELRLDTGKALRSATDNGAVVLERITATDEDFRMPPIGEPLTAEEIAQFKKWIEDGAVSPVNETAETDPAEHWAFVPPVTPAVPRKHEARVIDYLIEKQLRTQKIGVLDLAAAPQRLRRVYLDLIGVPPTPEEVTAFLEDAATTRYGTVVDRLLADFRYGQRWARHWMDIWRYSDWYGRRNQNDVRNSSAQIWMWRDWIVDSLNNNVGYDVMVQQMLAADEMSPLDDSQWPATGYLVRNYYSLNPNEWMRHNVEYTGKAFLGLTFNCAHCHDHKYDPIEHDDYFRLRAFFEPMSIRMDQVAGAPRPDEFVEYLYAGSRQPALIGMARVFDKSHDAITHFYNGGDERNRVTDHVPIEPGVPRFLEHLLPQVSEQQLPTEAWYPGARQSVHDYEMEQAAKQLTIAKAELLELSPIDVGELRAAAVVRKNVQVELDAAIKQVNAQGRGALEGRYSLLLDARQGRRVLSNHLPEVKELVEDTVISFQLLILDEGQVNFQLIRDHKGSLTAGYVGFENGVIYSYTPGGFSRFVVGKYDFANGERRFRAKLLIHPATDNAELTIDVLNVESEVFRELATVSMAINGWNPVGTDNKPILLDCRTGTQAVFDDIRVAIPKHDEIVLNFEGKDYSAGQDVDEINNWKVGSSSVAPASSKTIEVIDSELVRVLRKSVDEADAAMSRITLMRDAAIAAVTAAEANMLKLEAVIAADVLRYRDAGIDRGQDLIKAAVTKSIEADGLIANAELLASRVALVAAEKIVDKAQRKTAVTAAQARVVTAEASVTAAKKATTEPPADYNPLSVQTPKTSTGRRTALARMLTHRNNPLTARVAVNHIWLRHFHVPLVETVFDFGRNGKPPTHPGVLDYLAVQLMESGWDMKKIHRLIVMSDAYQRSSQGNVRNGQVDPDNVWLWRMNSGRMEAEIVRDSLLYIANDLNRSTGGRSLENTKALTTNRRSLYYETYPEAGGSNPLGELFDAPNPFECYRRTSTIVPQQALALNNSDFVHQIAEKTVLRIEKMLVPPLDTQLDRAFVQMAFIVVLSRLPSAVESSKCEAFLSSYGDNARAGLIRVLINHSDFVSIQ
ncbi:MAG: DUF1553 domain-containing protein [Planctomycetaceae bacterium]|nr:DUF1553 domain-containing protein [Planctomycetaceae bacterium]